MGGSIEILFTNDLHGKLTPDRMPALLEQRADCDLYFDTGDCIKAGNLGVPLAEEEAWGLLAKADITASVPGNRESHILPGAVKAKFRGHKHPVLCCNWRDKDGTLMWEPYRVFEAKGLKVGVVAGMVPMVTERMATRAASQYVWDPPIPSLTVLIRQMRSQVDLLIALTHIGLPQDRKLAEACPELDMILGGHSHNVIDKPDVSNGVPILQTGSHGRFIGRAQWTKGEGLTRWELIPWAHS